MPAYFTAALSISTFFGCALSLAFPHDSFQDDEPAPGQPMMINLRRESVPVKRQGKVVSFKTSYSGIIGVGGPVPQQFRVVFDTGSGHVVVPASSCDSEACMVHKRFNTTASESAIPINVDGAPVPTGKLCDQVDISFGTGQITGEFVRDKVCLGFPSDLEDNSLEDVAPDAQNDTMPVAVQQPAAVPQTCLEMNVLTAVKMSTQPFKAFNFDGIMGLGLASLAVGDDFSFFEVMTKSGKLQSAHFGVFLTEGDVEGEESEIAIGGYNENRFLNPLAWSPVALAHFGYWQVNIIAVRVDGVELDVCKDGTCRGVVDTGTSHLGIPAPYNVDIAAMLAVDAGDLLDCRLAKAPVVEIELASINLTLGAENYMRRLPLREGVNVGSTNGVDLLANGSRNEKNDTMEPTPWMDENSTNVTRHCTPRIMAVNIPEPVGPKLFILGEPVLHRYYSVYDWKRLKVGFSLANNRRNTLQPGMQLADERGALPGDVDKLLMQQSVVSRPFEQADLDSTFFKQVQVRINIRDP